MLPSLFLSHGSPMLVLEPCEARDFLVNLGHTMPRPEAIIVASAHWETEAPTLGSAAHPPTIHDFYGFPPALFRITYPAPGSPTLAARAAALLAAAGLHAALDPTRGLDHGVWAPLILAWPEADIPVLPISLQTWQGPAHHLALGAALAPPLIAALMTAIGWQSALWWTGLPAIPLFLCWVWYGRNSPREHRGVSVPELAIVPQAVSEGVNSRSTLAELAHVLRDRHVLLLSFSYFTMNYLFYLLANWCFLYLVQQRHFSVLASGWLATAPPIAAGVGAGIGGVLASALFTRLGCRRGLRLTPLVALPVAGMLLLIAAHASDAKTAVALLALCYFFVELTEGSFWATAMTIGHSNTMVVGGVLTLGGSLGGVVGIPIVAYLSGHGAWNTAFLIGTGCALVSALLWVFIDPSHSATSATSIAATINRRTP